MAANKGAESKQGLIITLVCFILLSIILVITTYYGYAGQADKDKSVADAKKEADSAKKDRDWYKFVALHLQSFTGDLNKQETETLADYQGRYRANQLTSIEDKAVIDSLFKELQTRLAKDATTIEPYRQRVARLEEELKNARASLQSEKNNLAKERTENARLIAVKNAELKEASDNLQKALADNVANQKQMAQQLEEKLKEFETLSIELEKEKKKYATDLGTIRKQQKRAVEENKDLREVNEKQRLNATPPDLHKFSTPKGKIMKLDPAGQMAWINLGSADNVRPEQGLTFSIFGHGIAGRGSNERKGALELVNVLGPHLSQAKITETVDPRNNPIQTEDVLVNPAWSPTMQGHVAIAGLIDFSGEGRDHIDELMRGLQKQNVVIDAYVDLKEAAIKGTMTVKTEYLILGEPPDINVNTPIREGDARFDRKTAILDKMGEMQARARELGELVHAESTRDFVRRAKDGWKRRRSGARVG